MTALVTKAAISSCPSSGFNNISTMLATMEAVGVDCFATLSHRVGGVRWEGGGGIELYFALVLWKLRLVT